MKIGIFGGTFDPFHVGHMAIVERAFDQLKLDKIFIVPTTVNYYRPDTHHLFTFDQRCRAIQHFICGCDKPVEIDTIEKDKDGTWRSIDLVQYFNKKFPNDELYLLIGEDSYKEFKTWTRWEDILTYVKLAVANRGYANFIGKDFKADVPAESIDMGDDFEECSATNVRNLLAEECLDMYLNDAEWYGRRVK